jgi:hypothetical protein
MPMEVTVPALLTEVRAHRAGPGHWIAQVPRDWWSWAGPQGGLLAAASSGPATAPCSRRAVSSAASSALPTSAERPPWPLCA